MSIQLDITDLEWTDKYGSYRVCPACHGVIILMAETEDGQQQEWNCESCWLMFDEDGRRIGKFHRPGCERITCPQCGDFRVDKDDYDGCYYCRNCQSAFRRAEIETYRNADGQPTGLRIIDLGPVERPQTCPNCGDSLRAQLFDLPDGGSCWAFPCRACGIVYLADDDRRLVRPPECPKCGGYSLYSYTETRLVSVHPLREIEEKFQECRFCKTRFSEDGDYLNDRDRPSEGNRQSGNYSIGVAPSLPRIGG